MREQVDNLIYRIGRSRRIQTAILFLLIGGFIALYWGLKTAHVMDGPIFRWENAAYQIRSIFVKPPEEIKKIVIVEVDDETLWKIHLPWAFPRSIHAEFLKKAAQFDPKLITFHFMFAGKTQAQEDQALAEAVREAGNVILADRMTINGDYLISEPEIQSRALASGIISKPRETDNSLRRGYTYFALGEKEPMGVLSSELATLLLDEGMKKENLKIEPNQLLIPTGGGKMAGMPLMEYGTADINYKVNQNAFERIPFWRVYVGDVSPDLLKDKIVMVGITSRILLDIYGTPLGEMPGVVANAYNLLMLMTRDFLHRVPAIFQMLLLFLIGGLMGWIGFRHSFFKALAGALGILAAFVGISAWLFWNDWMWDLFGPMLVLTVAFVVSNAARSAVLFLENLSVRQEAVTDPLTKLYTRRFLESKVEHELEQLKKSRKSDLSVLMTDVDHFKSVNDTFGHDEGDRVLINVAKALKAAARRGDVLTRYGGEEFCVVMPDTNKEDAVKAAERYREAISQAVTIEKEGKVVRNVTVSVGVSSAREDNFMAFLPLVKGADQALYQSKESGRNRVTAYQKDFGNGEKTAHGGEEKGEKAA